MIEKKKPSPAQLSGTKIVCVAWLTAKYGGAHRYLESLIDAMVSKGASIFLVVNENSHLGPMLSRMSSAQVSVYPINMKDIAKSRQFVDDLVVQCAPDVIHFNSGASNVRSIALSMSSFHDRKFRSVFTMHGPLVNPKYSRSRIIQNIIPYSQSRRSQSSKRRFSLLFDQIISVSKQHVEAVATALRLPGGLFIHIPNGVDTKQFCPQQELPQSAEITIGACGGLVNVKRFDILLIAFSKLEQRKSLTLKIAGEGVLRSDLQQLSEQLGISQNITLVGHQEDMPQFYRSLDIFAITSDSEGFPYAQVEAMSSALPSVVTDVGDLPLMVRDEIDGFVVERRDTDKIAIRLNQLVENHELRNQMGASARSRAKANFSQENCIQKTIEVIMNCHPSVS